MGILSKMLLIGLTGISISQIQKNSKEKDQKKTSEENSREDTFCFFEDGISQADFNAAVYRAGKVSSVLSGCQPMAPLFTEQYNHKVESPLGILHWILMTTDILQENIGYQATTKLLIFLL